MCISLYELRRGRYAAPAADEWKNGDRRLPPGARHTLRDYKFSGEGLNRGSAGNSKITNRLEVRFLVFAAGKQGNRRRRLLGHLRSGLRDRCMPHMANLAMLFVGSVPVPVPGNLHGKAAHGENQDYGQQPNGNSFRHRKIHHGSTPVRHHRLARPIRTIPD